MNDHLNDISKFLDGDMSPEEARAFMERVSNDNSLRNLFEKELEIRSLFNGELSDINGPVDLPINDPMFQSADEYIAIIEKGLTAKDAIENNPAPVIPLYKRYRYAIAAAAILLLIFSDLYIFNPQHRIAIANLFNKQQPINDTAQNKKDSLSLPPSDRQQNINPIAALSGKELYAKYHSYYEGGTNPPDELLPVLSDLLNKKYSAVVAVNSDDYLNSRGGKNKEAEAFIDFYKGISYLELNSGVKAINYLDSVMQSKNAPTQITKDAKWFYALALLHQDDTKKAEEIFSLIASDGNSPYREKAKDILGQLK